MSNPEADPGGTLSADVWAVWRIDDNRNTFVVRDGLGQAEAERLVAEFTARGHKQMYWAEPEAGRAKQDAPLESAAKKAPGGQLS